MKIWNDERDEIITTNIAQTGKVTRNGDIERDETASSSDLRALVQGFSKKSLIKNTSAYTPVYYATQTNEGQIASYPFQVSTKIGGSRKKYIDIAASNCPYIQLNMEDDDIVVWYSVYREAETYSDGRSPFDVCNIMNDGTNNYYIYNKGNVTYSGVGQCQGKLKEDEYKLFMNTMVAAYRASAQATEPVIMNKDKSIENGKDYLYVDYDATLKKDQSTEPIIGDDIYPVYKTTEGGEEVVDYYTKRVKFTLRNYSILLNKVMTVNYYPVVKDTAKNISVVLYDYPMELQTFRIDPDNPKNGIPLTADTSKPWTLKQEVKDSITNGNKTNPVFIYKIPEGMTITDEEKCQRNSAIVGVSSGQGVVNSLQEYYVDIPISESYYTEHLGLPIGESYEYSYNTMTTDISTGEVTFNKHNDGSVQIGKYGLDQNSSFEVEIQVVMRYGRDQSTNPALVGTRGVVFMRRGMFTLD